MTVCYEHISYKVDISAHYKYATYSIKKWCFIVSCQKYEFFHLGYKMYVVYNILDDLVIQSVVDLDCLDLNENNFSLCVR